MKEDGIQLTAADIKKYRQEIDNTNINDKEKIIDETIRKLSNLYENKKLDQLQSILVQKINGLYSILSNTPNLEDLVQQKILFTLKYFLKGQDEIPDNIPEIGYLDDLAVVDWIIDDIQEQYSHYFKA